MAASSKLDGPVRMLDRHQQVLKKANSKKTKKRVNTRIANAVKKTVYERIDARARANPGQYHHLYEWGMVGNPMGRLFQLRAFGAGGDSVQITYNFLPSRMPVPGSNGSVFAAKAFVMENQIPVRIEAEPGEFLAFEDNGTDVFAKAVNIAHPGGIATRGTMRENFNALTRPSAIARNSLVQQILKEETKRILSELKKR